MIEWTCTIVDASTTNCQTVASSTGLYTGATYHEWLFVAGIIIFFLSFIGYGRMFGRLKKE